MAQGAYVAAGGIKSVTSCYVGAGGVKEVSAIYVGQGSSVRLVWPEPYDDETDLISAVGYDLYTVATDSTTATLSSSGNTGSATICGSSNLVYGAFQVNMSQINYVQVYIYRRSAQSQASCYFAASYGSSASTNPLKDSNCVTLGKYSFGSSGSNSYLYWTLNCTALSGIGYLKIGGYRTNDSGSVMLADIWTYQSNPYGVYHTAGYQENSTLS